MILNIATQLAGSCIVLILSFGKQDIGIISRAITSFTQIIHTEQGIAAISGFCPYHIRICAGSCLTDQAALGDAFNRRKIAFIALGVGSDSPLEM